MIEFDNLNPTKPYNIFLKYYKAAIENNQKDIQAVSISSFNKNLNEVDSRFVNLKYIINNEWIFFSNYNSPKAKSFISHDQISAVFYWSSINTQIRIKAIVKKTTDSFSDNYSAKWGSQNFMGRAESFYKYEGFDRSISMDWTVAAQSKQELIPMYQKLNYLASVCAPDYSSNGYMQGNLITLTVGGWCYEQTGIMTGLTLDVPNDSPWEIAINDEGKYDASVKELPMIINVSGFEFKPIHNFVPRVQQNSFAKKSWNGMGENFVETFGQERYLGLTNGTNSNYDNEGGAINYQAIKS